LAEKELTILQEEVMKQRSPETSFYTGLMQKLFNVVREEGISDNVI